MKVNKKFIVSFLLISNIALSQKSDVFYDKSNNYQIGIGASKFINSVFPTDKNSFLVEGRLRKNKTIHYRIGLDYDIDDSKNGSFKGGLKLGVDKLFKKTGKWFFYYGADTGYTHSYLKASKKHVGGVLLSPFIGIMYKFSKHFSVSTEPNVFLKNNFIIDKETFDKNNKTTWLESGFGKIGYIQLNFHF